MVFLSQCEFAFHSKSTRPLASFSPAAQQHNTNENNQRSSNRPGGTITSVRFSGSQSTQSDTGARHTMARALQHKTAMSTNTTHTRTQKLPCNFLLAVQRAEKIDSRGVRTVERPAASEFREQRRDLHTENTQEAQTWSESNETKRRSFCTKERLTDSGAGVICHVCAFNDSSTEGIG